MLTAEMRDQIESIQKRASKIIFGWDSHYDNVISCGKMETLDSRREELTRRFAEKTSKNTRFAHWFREKQYMGTDLRFKKRFEEDFARTERIKKSPVLYMQRLLNAN